MTENKKSIGEVFSIIQNELYVTKDRQAQTYKYRNVEDILSKYKQINTIHKFNCFVTLTDEAKFIDGQWFLIATATFHYENEKIISQSYVLHDIEPPTNRNGVSSMSKGQFSGVVSSYARKYALCGLLGVSTGEDLDDNDSSENTNNQNNETNNQREENSLITEEQKKQLEKALKEPKCAEIFNNYVLFVKTKYDFIITQDTLKIKGFDALAKKFKEVGYDINNNTTKFTIS